MRQGVTFVMIAIFLSACQTGGGIFKTGTAVGAVSGSAKQAIADDMADRLAEQMPPATTVIWLKNEQSDYSKAVEVALESRGNKVVKDGSEGNEKAVELHFSVERVDDQFLAQLSTPSITMARAYRSTDTGASPSSALSILVRN